MCLQQCISRHQRKCKKKIANTCELLHRWHVSNKENIRHDKSFFLKVSHMNGAFQS